MEPGIKLHQGISILASGNKYTGKTTIVRHIVKRYFLSRYLIYGPYTVIDDFQKQGFENVYVSKTNSPEEFEAFVGKVLKIGNLMFVVDEAQNFMPGGPGSKLGPNALVLVMYGRHALPGKAGGIGLITTTKRPALLNTTVREEANYLLLFRHMLPNDMEYLKEIVGPDVWILQRLKDHRFMIYDNSGGSGTGKFTGPYMLMGDKIMEDPDPLLRRDEAYIHNIGEECYAWLRIHGVKGVITKANVDVYIRDMKLDLLPDTKDAIYNYVNTKSKIKR